MRHCARFKKQLDGAITCEVYELKGDGSTGESAITSGTGSTREAALTAAYEAVKDGGVRSQLRAGILEEEGSPA